MHSLLPRPYSSTSYTVNGKEWKETKSQAEKSEGKNPSSVTVYLLQVSICRTEAFGIGHDSGVNVEFFSSWRGGEGTGHVRMYPYENKI